MSRRLSPTPSVTVSPNSADFINPAARSLPAVDRAETAAPAGARTSDAAHSLLRSAVARALPAAPAQPADTFANPIAHGADPWVVQHEGVYYWCSSENDLGVSIHRSTLLTERGEKLVVWRAPESGPYSKEVWAPELHRVDGRWYIYVAASDGRNETHRMIVLEAEGDSPFGAFRFKSELYTGDEIERGVQNRWAIDGTLLAYRGERYLLWSGWADERDEQWLYIARLENPWTVATNRVRLCANDDFLWERVGESRLGRGLNEAPQVLERAGRVFVVFSASGSWEASYKLGLLELEPGGDPLQPAHWRKHAQPLFQQAGRTYGPGHNCFVKSPDGREDWLVFHAKIETAHNWKRAIHLQPFTWDADGRPVLGAPENPGVALARPGGEVTHRADESPAEAETSPRAAPALMLASAG
jgi:GH43 family beta-xylosidase